MGKELEINDLIPAFTQSDIVALKAFSEFVFKNKARLIEKMKIVESQSLALKTLISGKMQEETLMTAMNEGKWDDSLRGFINETSTYIKNGISFREWFEAITALRSKYLDQITELLKSNDEYSDTLLKGLSLWYELNIGLTAEVFIFEKSKKLMEQNQRQEELIKELESFAFIISHDLKTPLRGIASVSDWLIKDYESKLDETGKEYLGLLKNRVVKLESLIDGVLHYSRAVRVDQEKEKINLNSIFEEVKELIGPEKNVNLVLDNSLPEIMFAKSAMIQVLSNLIGNAIKHNDKETVKINIGCIEKEEEYCIYVKDNGPGIPEEYHEKVFKIFQTLKDKEGASGSTGIGLTVVKKIVESNAGKVWIESNKEMEGSKFCFTVNKLK